MPTLRSLVLSATLAPALALGQNLVVNGSFEDYVNCPTSFGQWAQVVGWISPYTESADYYNSCAGGNFCSVPFNIHGYEFASEGEGYMGLYTYADGGVYREIIATQLTQPLTPGVPIHCSYKVSPGGFGSSVVNSPTLSALPPCVNFFNELPATSQPWLFSEWASYLFPNDCAVGTSLVLSDTAGWMTITGTYVPDSAYSWLAITNFYENGLSQAQVLDSLAPNNNFAYAFVDEVCISHDPMFCSDEVFVGGPQETFDPVTGHLRDGILYASASVPLSKAIIRLTDLQGRVLWTGTWPENTSRFECPMPSMAAAPYLMLIHPPGRGPLALKLAVPFDH